MTTYLTVQNLMAIFSKSESTIRRWIDEGRDIRFDGVIYTPDKDPGGCWRFKVRHIEEAPIEKVADTVVEKKQSRRILSRGI